MPTYNQMLLLPCTYAFGVQYMLMAPANLHFSLPVCRAVICLYQGWLIYNPGVSLPFQPTEPLPASQSEGSQSVPSAIMESCIILICNKGTLWQGSNNRHVTIGLMGSTIHSITDKCCQVELLNVS